VSKNTADGNVSVYLVKRWKPWVSCIPETKVWQLPWSLFRASITNSCTWMYDSSVGSQSEQPWPCGGKKPGRSVSPPCTSLLLQPRASVSAIFVVSPLRKSRAVEFGNYTQSAVYKILSLSCLKPVVSTHIGKINNKVEVSIWNGFFSYPIISYHVINDCNQKIRHKN